MGFLSKLLPVAGTVVGGMFGMPQLGGAVGGLLGGALGGGGGGGNPVTMADPFAPYRQQYASDLSTFMKTQPYDEASKSMQTMAMSGGPVTNLGAMSQIAGERESEADAALNQMITPGATFNPLDPSYNFRFQQGQQALERSAAAKGLLGSGNMGTALVDYGQQAASQEYGAQFGRLSSLSQLRSAQKAQQFGQLGAISSLQLADDQRRFGQLQAVDTSAQAAYQQQYSRLAQLAGAFTSSPAQAGSLLQQQQAGSAAFMQNAGKEISGALSNWLKKPGDTNENAGVSLADAVADWRGWGDD